MGSRLAEPYGGCRIRDPGARLHPPPIDHVEEVRTCATKSSTPSCWGRREPPSTPKPVNGQHRTPAATAGSCICCAGRRDALVAALVALVALGALVPASATYTRVADEFAGAGSGADAGTKAPRCPRSISQQATSAQPAAPSRTRALLVVVGAASVIVVLLRLRPCWRCGSALGRRPDTHTPIRPPYHPAAAESVIHRPGPEKPERPEYLPCHHAATQLPPPRHRRGQRCLSRPTAISDERGTTCTTSMPG
jgi:hypothetical protein